MRIPSYYLVSNNLSTREIEQVQHILGFTPLDCIIADDRGDHELAFQLCPLVLNSEALSNLNGRARFAIVGQYETPLQAVYQTGQKVILC
jgi:hypothetical protein